MIAHLDTLTQSIFLEMFGDSSPNTSLDEVAIVSSGITKGRKTPESTSPVPYLAVANVQAGHLKIDVVKQIAATESEIKRYALLGGDLLLTEGGDPDKLGRGTVWRNELPLCLHQNHIFRVRVREAAEVRPDYLSAYVASRPARTYFLQSAKQTTGIASINMTQLKALPVYVPPIAHQDAYTEQLLAVKRQGEAVSASTGELDALFASLQARAFRGAL